MIERLVSLPAGDRRRFSLRFLVVGAVVGVCSLLGAFIVPSEVGTAWASGPDVDGEGPMVAPPGVLLNPPSVEGACPPGGVPIQGDPRIEGTWDWCRYPDPTLTADWDPCDHSVGWYREGLHTIVFITWNTSEGILGTCTYVVNLKVSPAKVRISANVSEGIVKVKVAPVKKHIVRPFGKGLLILKAGKKTLKATLSTSGVAKVKLPKNLKKGTSVKVVFKGTDLLARAVKIISI